MNALPRLFHAEADPPAADVVLRDVKDLAQVFIGETVLLCRDKLAVGRKRAF